MKIRKLQLTGYKVFDELELDFTDLEGNILDTVVLAGVNGSGKTSILDLLEAIFSLKIIEVNTHRIEEEMVRGCESLKITVQLSLSELRKRYREHYGYHKNILEIILMEKKVPLTNSNLPVFRDYDNFRYYANSKYFSCCYIKLDFLNDRVQQDVAKYLVESLINGVVQKRELPAGLIIQEIIGKINNMFDGMDMKTKLVDITATEPIFESFNGKKISINQLSSGEKQLFCQAAYLQKLNLQDSIILIDEPETSLHPTWQRNILKLYQNIGKNNQIIVATHSPHVIASVKPESLFVLYPNAETGKIEPINMAKAHKHTKGVEPNQILQEIMGMEDLRDSETRQRIDEIAELLRVHPEWVDLPENEAKIENLRNDLGKSDPFIIRMNHQLLLIKRRNLSHEIHS
jgi:predicted ATP-binding protein involved in virulence